MSEEKNLILASPIGAIRITGNENHITCISFLEEAIQYPEKENYDILKEAARQIHEYFNGKRKKFDLPLKPSGTDFQLEVWKALEQIPFGETYSYLKIAELTGNSKANRAVGRANGQNPLAIVVPCHRVIGSNHQLTGYSGGLWRKKWLLEHEAAQAPLALFNSAG